MKPLAPRRSRRTADDPATLRQVAERAGVSIATVTRVVRGVDAVSDETQARVQRRRRSSSASVRTCVDGPSRPAVTRRSAWCSPGSPVPTTPRSSPASRRKPSPRAVRADPRHPPARPVPQAGARHGGPRRRHRRDGRQRRRRTCWTRSPRRAARSCQLAGSPGSAMPTVRTAGAEPVRQLTRHLVEDHGYDRLVFVGNPTGSPDGADRWNGFRQAHRDLGRPLPTHPAAGRARPGRRPGGGGPRCLPCATARGRSCASTTRSRSAC